MKRLCVVALQRTSDQTLSGPQSLSGLLHVCSRQAEDGENLLTFDLFRKQHCWKLRLLSCEQEMIESIREAVVYMAHTHDGARVAMRCLWHGTAKVHTHTHTHKRTFKFTHSFMVEMLLGDAEPAVSDWLCFLGFRTEKSSSKRWRATWWSLPPWVSLFTSRGKLWIEGTVEGKGTDCVFTAESLGVCSVPAAVDQQSFNRTWSTCHITVFSGL